MGPRNRKPGSVSPKLAEQKESIDTRKELAETAGVSQETFRKAEAVLNSDKRIKRSFEEILLPTLRAGQFHHDVHIVPVINHS